ncbi:MAG: HEAT repeat domain-containing protein [Planctomycetota bacterium]
MSRLGCWIVLLATPAFAIERQAERVLEEHELHPTSASIGAYLRTHFVDGAQKERVERLVAHLAHVDPTVRVLAARRLARMGPAPLATLREARARGTDPELVRRARIVATGPGPRLDIDLLRACFITIHARRLPGLVLEVLGVLPLCDSDLVHQAGCRALEATSGPGDAAVLEAHFGRGHGRTRYAAALAYGALVGAGGGDRLQAATRADDDHLRVGAARALAQLGDRRCLAPLADLLASRHGWVRFVAVQTLRAMTTARFGYSAHDATRFRTPATIQWRREAAALAGWKTPLPSRRVDLGRTLISNWTHKKIIELDERGNRIWETATTEEPWANRGLPDGHRIITYYKSKTVVAYDAKGRKVWTRTVGGHPTSVSLTSRGTILVACGTIVEFERDGRQVRSWPAPDVVLDARTLPNGNLLTALAKRPRIAELTPLGTIVWKLDLKAFASTAQPLPNGNVLVSQPSLSRVVELTRKGVVVWSRAGLGQGTIFSERLANGRTLIATRNGVRLVERDGTTRWFRKITGYLCATRH